MPRATPAAYTHSHPPPPQILSDDSYKTFLKRNWKSFDVRDMPVLEDEKTKAPKPRRSRRGQSKPAGGGGKEEAKGDEEGDLHGIWVRGAPPRHRVRRAHHSPRPRQTWSRGLTFDDVVDILKASVANAQAYATDGRGESRAVTEMLDMVRSAPRPSPPRASPPPARPAPTVHSRGG